MTTRYAYIVEGNTIWGPGPNPYFINLVDGTLWEVLAHSVEESEEKGIFVVEQKNKKNHDPRFEEMYTPVYSIINGRPVETYSYGFIPSALDNMLSAVDEKSESLRNTVTTPYPGQYAEYDEVYKEALQVNSLPGTATIDPEDYPYLQADLGITYSEDLERTVNTIKEAADLVIKTRNTWLEFGGIIRTIRLKAKKEIKNAPTLEKSLEICEKYVSGQTYREYIDYLLSLK